MSGIVADVPALGETKENNQACYVCSHPVASPHFGSISCLACAAFFRRTVALDLKFICGKEGRCNVFYELRMACRGCRFEKCLNVGMQRQQVLKRRVPNGEYAVSSKNVPEANSSPSGIYYDSCDQNAPFNVSEDLTSACVHNRSLEDGTTLDNSNSPTVSYSNVHEEQNSKENEPHLRDYDASLHSLGLSGSGLLTHYVTELKRAMKRRCVMFTSTPLRAITEPFVKMPYVVDRTKPHTMKRQVETQKFDHLLAYEYCEACPGYNLLSDEEKIIFFRTATMSFCLLDIAWITYQCTSPSDLVIMYTDGSICSVDDYSVGWDDEEDLKSGEKIRIFMNFMQRFHSAIINPFFEYHVDEVEYAALKAFCVWKMGYCEYTHKMRALSKEHEKGLLIGLNSYYENRTDKAERLGNIILLMGTIYEMYHSITLTYRSGNLFRLFQMDDISKNLLLV